MTCDDCKGFGDSSGAEIYRCLGRSGDGVSLESGARGNHCNLPWLVVHWDLLLRLGGRPKMSRRASFPLQFVYQCCLWVRRLSWSLHGVDGVEAFGEV